MIIIKLQGGLGNQLFQYALGKTIEKKYSKEVAYDLSFYNNQQKFTSRAYYLDKFNIKLRIANDDEVHKTKYPFGVFSKISYLIGKAVNKFFIKKYHISYEVGYWESIKNKDSAYLEGYWQSFRYVEPCLNDLKKEVTLKGDMTSSFKSATEEVLKGESVAVHIRRGDYVTPGGDLQSLDVSYYKKANNYILGRLSEVRYYVFTDDTRWVKENFDFLGKENVKYVSELGLSDYEELALMTKCKNIIIANSSFSWWGAVLSNKDGIIICPEDWRNIFLKNSENLCPKEWVRI